MAVELEVTLQLLDKTQPKAQLARDDTHIGGRDGEALLPGVGKELENVVACPSR